MRLLREEIKKTWRLPIVAAILALSALTSYMFLSFYLPVNKPYLRGNAWGEITALTELMNRFGSEMDDFERAEADALMDEYFATLEDYINAHPIYAEHGIYSTADLRDCYLQRGKFAWLETAEEPTDENGFDYHGELFSKPLFFGDGRDETGNIMWVIQALSEFLREYDIRYEIGIPVYGEYTALQKERIAELNKRESFRSINSSYVLESTTAYASRAVIIILLSVAVLLSPYLADDNRRGMAQMQWSAKSGRGTLKTQFAAAMLSAFALIAVEVAVIAGLFALFNRDFAPFGGQLLYGADPIPWLDLTYAEYGAALIALCFALPLGAAAVFAFLSHKSQNPVSLLFKAIPAFIAAAIIGNSALYRSLTFGNKIFHLTRIAFSDVAACAIVTAIGAALCVWACRRVKKAEI